MPAATPIRFLDELKALLRIPSVSTLPEHKADVRRAAQVLAAELSRIGMENVAAHRDRRPSAGLRRLASRPRQANRTAAMDTTTSSRPIRSTNGTRRPLSPPSATAISMPAEQSTTRARCTCTSRLSNPCSPAQGKLAHQCSRDSGRRRRSWRGGDRPLRRRASTPSSSPISPLSPTPRCSPPTCPPSASACAA